MFIKKHALACMILLSGGLTAAAAPVTYDFTADINFASRQLRSDLDTSTSTLSGTFIYDDAAPLTGPNVYGDDAITDFSFDIVTTSGLVSMSLNNDNLMELSVSGWGYRDGTTSATPLPLSGNTLSSARFNISATMPAPLALPSDLSVFTNGTMDMFFADVRGRSHRALYDVTSITARNVTPPPTVPEPAPLALLGLGLVGFGLMKRRKVTS